MEIMRGVEVWVLLLVSGEGLDNAERNTTVVVFLFLFFFGISSMVAFIGAQIYVKRVAPDLWERFFPGRMIGFSYDLNFPRLPRWLLSNEGKRDLLQLPWFRFLWNVYLVIRLLVAVLFFVYLVDFGFEVYKVGMIGGWRFR